MVSRLKTLTAEYRDLKARLEQGGGPDKVKRQHDQKKLTARERVARLLDDGGPWLEVGLLVAYDQYDGQAPAAGVVSPVGPRHGRAGRAGAHQPSGAGGPSRPRAIQKITRAPDGASRPR